MSPYLAFAAAVLLRFVCIHTSLELDCMVAALREDTSTPPCAVMRGTRVLEAVNHLNSLHKSTLKLIWRPATPLVPDVLRKL